MKKIVLITLLSYLSYSTLPIFSAAPPAADAGSSSMRATEYQPAGEVEEQLEDWWALSQEERIQDAMAQQLARIYVAKSVNPTPSIAELEKFFNKGKGHAFPPSIIQQIHRTVHMQNPITIRPVALFGGSYNPFRQAYYAEIQRRLQGQQGNYVHINLPSINLGTMEPTLLFKFIQELNAWISGLQCYLLSLDLNDNDLTVLLPGTFGGLEHLQQLRLDGNQLAALPAGTFDGLQNLQNLYLGGNKLVTLPPEIFNGLQNLRNLHLGHNELTTLPRNILSDLRNLQELELSGNQLTTLPSGIFDSLQNLWQLSLNYNRLTTLEPRMFSGLQYLQVLELSYNRLKALEPRIFDGLQNLREVWLFHNPITSDVAAIQRLRQQLPHVKVL